MTKKKKYTANTLVFDLDKIFTARQIQIKFYPILKQAQDKPVRFCTRWFNYEINRKDVVPKIPRDEMPIRPYRVTNRERKKGIKDDMSNMLPADLIALTDFAARQGIVFDVKKEQERAEANNIYKKIKNRIIVRSHRIHKRRMQQAKLNVINNLPFNDTTNDPTTKVMRPLVHSEQTEN